MKLLYCGDCGNYLMTASGDCRDCSCGWKQPAQEEYETDFIRAIREAYEAGYDAGWEDSKEFGGYNALTKADEYLEGL
jgi:hypothetical protein